MSFKTGLVWLRRDLRLNDHAALSLATHECDQVYVVFVYDTVILDELPTKKDRRVVFIHESLTELDEALVEKNARLITAFGNPVEIIPSLAQEFGAEIVVAAHDDDPYALKRDSQVKKDLKTQKIEFKTVLDHLIKERRDVMKPDGTPYRVFTPYSKAWRTAVEPKDLSEHPVQYSSLKTPPKLKLSNAKIGNHSLSEIGFEPVDVCLAPAQKAAQKRLKEFLNKIDDYGQARDFPALEGTSMLSVDLRFGTISVRECFRAVANLNSNGARKWESELIWREFYHMLLANFPEIGEGKSFQPDLNNLSWPGSKEDFEKWKAGKTGYPLVDAAMRCFAATGTMHNRLRMVVAMFLTKDLLVDWHWGEQYFAENLLDFELASNNGGWQWSASTGADAQPYFRIFNPILQSKKFDPEGEFIRKWVPELRELDNKDIHWPFEEDGSRSLLTPADYPDPIVNHFEQKAKVLALFDKQAR
ncbi:MAG: deoxyribodipyrimidine photo-lyase [Fimbriimonadaceae bacterium]|nr:deoxyribodipyrimidine photo-lyase [Fimbriimonadaceae bacterium]